MLFRNCDLFENWPLNQFFGKRLQGLGLQERLRNRSICRGPVQIHAHVGSAEDYLKPFPHFAGELLSTSAICEKQNRAPFRKEGRPRAAARFAS